MCTGSPAEFLIAPTEPEDIRMMFLAILLDRLPLAPRQVLLLDPQDLGLRLPVNVFDPPSDLERVEHEKGTRICLTFLFTLAQLANGYRRPSLQLWVRGTEGS